MSFHNLSRLLGTNTNNVVQTRRRRQCVLQPGIRPFTIPNKTLNLPKVTLAMWQELEYLICLYPFTIQASLADHARDICVNHLLSIIHIRFHGTFCHYFPFFFIKPCLLFAFLLCSCPQHDCIGPKESPFSITSYRVIAIITKGNPPPPPPPVRAPGDNIGWVKEPLVTDIFKETTTTKYDVHLFFRLFPIFA